MLREKTMLKKAVLFLITAPFIIQSWQTYTAKRDCVSLWLYDYGYVITQPGQPSTKAPQKNHPVPPVRPQTGTSSKGKKK